MYLESRVQPVAVVSFVLLSGDITNLIWGSDLSLFFFPSREPLVQNNVSSVTLCNAHLYLGSFAKTLAP